MVNRNIDYSTRDYEGFRQDLIDLLKQRYRNTQILVNQTQG